MGGGETRGWFNPDALLNRPHMIHGLDSSAPGYGLRTDPSIDLKSLNV